MSIQFKVANTSQPRTLRSIIAALKAAGFAAERLFPGQKRIDLETIYSIGDADATDLGDVKRVLRRFGDDIEYVEAAPDRSLRSRAG